MMEERIGSLSVAADATSDASLLQDMGSEYMLAYLCLINDVLKVILLFKKDPCTL